MRKNVFNTYSEVMSRIIRYKVTDKNGNERKCVVSTEEAKKHPERYKIYNYHHPNLEGRSIGYDPAVVKLFTKTFKNLCSILPQVNLGLEQIPLALLINDENLGNPQKAIRDLYLGETFLALAYECDVIEYLLQDKKENPGFVSGTLKEHIESSYNKYIPDDEQK